MAKVTIGKKMNSGNGDAMMSPKDLPMEKAMKEAKDKMSPAEREMMKKKHSSKGM